MIKGKEGNRRKYDAEFKREAIQLIVERDLSVKKVAEDLPMARRGDSSQHAWELEKAVS